MWLLSDLAGMGINAVLVLYLCKDALTWRKKYEKCGKYLFFILFVIIGYWINNSHWLNVLLYGESMAMQSSKTIAKMFFMMILHFLLLDLLYEGKRLLKGYLVLLYRTIIELSVFSIYGFWTLALNLYSEWQIGRVLDNVITLDDYMAHMQSLELIGNLILMMLRLGIACIAVRAILRYRQDMRNTGRQGILFLMLSPAVGMAFVVILRCICITQTETEYDFLYDKHKEMYTVIPVMTFLCLLSIVYSCKIYKELMAAQEEKNRMLFYKQQLTDMTGHVQEMERLYDGIRGMRHDMNNYIADMEQLFLTGMTQSGPEDTDTARYPDMTGTDKSPETEGRQYLHRMREALESLTPRCNTGNPVMDVIMNRKWQECEKAGIVLESDFIYPEQLGIEAFDLGILLNNALDNAVEACKKCRKNEPLTIRVHSYLKGRMLFLRIENDCNGDEISYAEDHSLQTTKEDDSMHGIGLKNMNSVVKRYFGTMSYEIHDNVFFLTIMLQGRKQCGIS